MNKIGKKKNLLLIMNPCAGTKKANKYLTDILVLFGSNGYNNTVYMTEAAGDAKKYAKENAKNFDLVVAIGGDGAFTEVSYTTPQNVKNILGHLAYALEGVKDIANLKSKHLRFVADGALIEDDFIFGAICNSTSVGGIIGLDPKVVDLSYGLFELLLIRLPKDILELNEILVALSSKKYNTKMVTFLSAKNITIETEEDINWTLDGEFAYGELLIKVKNLNQAIKFITNRGKGKDDIEKK